MENDHSKKGTKYETITRSVLLGMENDHSKKGTKFETITRSVLLVTCCLQRTSAKRLDQTSTNSLDHSHNLCELFSTNNFE